MNTETYDSIACRFGTPLYLYKEQLIIQQTKLAKNVIGARDCFFTYAVKANNNPHLLKLIHENGFGMEIATPGEFSIALKAGVSPFEMIWNSNGKTREQIDFFVKNGIGAVNIDSIEEMELWQTATLDNSPERITQFFLRVNPCVDPVTHPYLATGITDSKFGIHENLIPEALLRAKEMNIIFSGLHTHIGSQITDHITFSDVYSRMFDLSAEYGFQQVNLGGGWGINYSDKTLNLDEISKTIQRMNFNCRILMELGRFIIGEAGSYIVKVVQVKWSGSKHFVVVDGGMNHLIRPALYGAIHPYEVLGDKGSYSPEFDIVGPLCESGDFLIKKAKGLLPKTGSIIIFKCAGAYGYSMANHYNGTSKPAEVLLTAHGEVKEIRERERIG